jgi:hypothetical protein
MHQRIPVFRRFSRPKYFLNTMAQLHDIGFVSERHQFKINNQAVKVASERQQDSRASTL